MNGATLLDWLLERTNTEATNWEPAQHAAKRELHLAQFMGAGYDYLLGAVDDLSNQKMKWEVLPERQPESQEALDATAGYFRNDVSFVSLVLSSYYPDEYVFYRVGAFDAAIIEGLTALGSVVPEFSAGRDEWPEINYAAVGRKGINKYLDLNKRLISFANRMWPHDPPHRPSLMYFLYEGLGRLFSREPDYRTYWLMVGAYNRFDRDLRHCDEMLWSGKSEMQKGDIVFMHRSCKAAQGDQYNEDGSITNPDTVKKSMLTDVYRVIEQPVVDPWAGWDGFWAKIRRVAVIDHPLRFAQFRSDPVLMDWPLVKKQFIGVICEPIPYRYYNRLIELMDENDRRNAGLQPEEVGPTRESGTYINEKDFDEREVGPYFRQTLQLKAAYQHTVEMYVGNKRAVLRLDYLISDGHGPITVVEDDISIPSRSHRKHAAALGQARSYALLLNLPSCMVAAPEGYWLYEMRGTEARLCEGFDGLSHQEMVERRDEVREKLLDLRKRHLARRR